MSLLQSLKRIVLPLTGLTLGGAVAVIVVGVRSQEHSLLTARLDEFQNLNSDQQTMVKASHAEYSRQSDERRREIVALHKAVQKDPELNSALERFSSWWSSLSQAEWDSFPAMDREQQIAFAKARIDKRAGSAAVVIVEFSGWGQTSLQPLHLTFDECERIITLFLHDTQIPPDTRSEVHQLRSHEHRSLAYSLWLFDQFRNTSDREALLQRSEQVLKSILENVQDEAWSKQFGQIVEENSDRRFFKFWMFQNLLVILKESTMVLGNRLTKEFPVSEEEIVKSFVSMEDKKRQHSLMIMPSDEARQRLEFLSQTSRAQTPEQKLLVKFISFARERESIVRAITFQLANRSNTPAQSDQDPE